LTAVASQEAGGASGRTSAASTHWSTCRYPVHRIATWNAPAVVSISPVAAFPAVNDGIAAKRSRRTKDSATPVGGVTT
jgi:hypothetical protein